MTKLNTCENSVCPSKAWFERRKVDKKSKPTRKLKQTNSILESYEHFSHQNRSWLFRAILFQVGAIFLRHIVDKLQELEDVSVWLLSYVSFIGYQFESGWHSRQQFWHTSVNMVRLRNTCSHTVSRRQRALAVVTCVLHRWDSWSFLERGRNAATVASPSKDPVSGTVCPLSCTLQTFHRLCSETNWKLICSTSTSRNCFSTFAAPFLSCTATCELALYK